MDYLPIFITGTDGSGKTTLTEWLKEHLENQGTSVQIVWSRYNNLFSKPLLAATRLTGHNYYEKHDGHLFGYHDFQKLSLFRKIYTLLQSIDVNIATRRNILRHLCPGQMLICERGPWDTLADVMLDTGNMNLHKTLTGKRFVTSVQEKFKVFFISRSRENIIKTRPELEYDRSLTEKIRIYHCLAEAFGWEIIENNGSLSSTKDQLIHSLSLRETTGEAG